MDRREYLGQHKQLSNFFELLGEKHWLGTERFRLQVQVDPEQIREMKAFLFDYMMEESIIDYDSLQAWAKVRRQRDDIHHHGSWKKDRAHPWRG